ncbi:GntR family transcriptional regulator [Peribacillus saganii]|uniref:GntR family transcriptional regulator n=1 Tax=Peribacillus saganii TaxID=2303992 RepID=A0A372LG57_9BACI|nr:GntR family transcriptional regulator [Peribacillus saganii]RFU64535.1 GntR family transcriptional regulator [Peribacillus saganii]
MELEQNQLQKAVPYYEQLQQTLKTRIWNGLYKPGERIIEAQIAKELSISRSPVREAIRALINEGLLVTDEKSQIIVYEPSILDVKEIYECRIALESAAVALSAERITEEQVSDLEKILQETETAIKQGDKEGLVACNAKFHQYIIICSGNSRLKKLVDDLQSLTHFFRVINIEGPNRGETILKGHKEIFEAIKKRDPEQASRKLADHTREDLANIIQIIEQKGER